MRKNSDKYAVFTANYRPTEFSGGKLVDRETRRVIHRDAAHLVAIGYFTSDGEITDRGRGAVPSRLDRSTRWRVFAKMREGGRFFLIADSLRDRDTGEVICSRYVAEFLIREGSFIHDDRGYVRRRSDGDD